MSENSTHLAEVEMNGWLFKWTNYLKGYQKRWFVLSNGLLSYYRSVDSNFCAAPSSFALSFNFLSKFEILFCFNDKTFLLLLYYFVFCT